MEELFNFSSFEKKTINKIFLAQAIHLNFNLKQLQKDKSKM